MRATGVGGEGQASSRLPTIAGPCLTAASLARTLRLSVNEIEHMTAEYQLLALTTADEHTVYPSFQLDYGAIIEHLGDVLRILRHGIDDPWT